MSSTGATLVIKVGGAAVAATEALPPALDDVAALVRSGHRVVLVHGGGPEITRWSERLGLRPRFVAGLRHSDPDTVAVAEMVLGRVGKGIAAALTAQGVDAVSLGGRDGRVLTARPRPLRDASGAPADLGLVGEVAGVRTEVLTALLEAGLLPVLSSVAAAPDGTVYNINADDAAADVAAALGADCLCLATDVPGVLVPGRDDPLPRLDEAEAQRLIGDGTIRGGMRPKVEACLRAVRGGVAQARIVDGRRPGAVAAAVAGDASPAGRAALGPTPARQSAPPTIATSCRHTAARRSCSCAARARCSGTRRAGPTWTSSAA